MAKACSPEQTCTLIAATTRPSLQLNKTSRTRHIPLHRTPQHCRHCDRHRSVNVERRHARISFILTETNYLKHKSLLANPNPLHFLYCDRLLSIIYVQASFIVTTYGDRLPLITAITTRQSCSLARDSFQHLIEIFWQNHTANE